MSTKVALAAKMERSAAEGRLGQGTVARHANGAKLIGCGLRRAEAAVLKLEDVQLREGNWVVADLHGKGGRIRTVPMPAWVKNAIDEWPASLQNPLFRAINKAGRAWGSGFTPKVIWSIVKEAAAGCGLTGLSPHDLPRTCARLCHQTGGELEQIQFLLGHVSTETTEKYIGCK
jgi:integrase